MNAGTMEVTGSITNSLLTVNGGGTLAPGAAAPAGTGGDYLTFTQGTGTLAVVPEPSTLALAAIAGIGGLALLRRRRK